MIVYFADTPTGFLGRDDETEDDSGGAGRGGKDGARDEGCSCLLYVTAKWRNVIRGSLP